MEQSTAQNKNKGGLYNFAKQGLMIAAVCSIMFSTVDPAEAARSGGRVGGRAPSSSMRSAPRPAARPSAPSSSSYNRGYNAGASRGGNTTVIMGGGRGFGYSPFGMGYGGGFGYGYGGGLFGYNPALSLGLTLFDVSIRENQRQAYLQ